MNVDSLISQLFQVPGSDSPVPLIPTLNARCHVLTGLHTPTLEVSDSLGKCIGLLYGHGWVPSNWF